MHQGRFTLRGILLICLVIFSISIPQNSLFNNTKRLTKSELDLPMDSYQSSKTINLLFDPQSYKLASNYKLYRIGTLYTASEDILSINFIGTNVLVVSEEYNSTIGKYFYNITAISIKTFNVIWTHMFDHSIEQIVLYDLNEDGKQEVLVNSANFAYVFKVTDGTLLWQCNFSEPILVAPLWDIDDDSLIEIFVISQYLYSDVFGLGFYYWKTWITDINTLENYTINQWIKIPTIAWPNALAVGNWSLTNNSKVAVFYKYGPSITFVDPLSLVTEKIITLSSDWLLTESIVYTDEYLLFFDYISDTGTYRVINIFNESLLWTYQMKDEYPYKTRLYLTNLDTEEDLEVLTLVGGDISILEIATGMASYNSPGDYYQVIPFDINGDNLSEILTFEFYTQPRILNNTLLVVSNVTGCPEEILQNPNDVWPLLMNGSRGIYFMFFINRTASESLEVYSIKESTVPELEIITPLNNTAVYWIVEINCSAYDAESGIQRVEIFLDGISIANISSADGNNYVYYWDTTTVEEGPHIIGIAAYDNAGNINYKILNIIVDNSSPDIISITPENGSWLNGEVAISINVIDNISEVDIVYFVIDFAQPTQIIYEDEDPPFQILLDTTKIAEGAHNIMFIAYDSAGNADVKLLVYYIDNTSPSLEVTNLVNWQILRGVIKIQASATDSLSGISNVEFYIDGELIQSDTKTPYECSLDTTKINDGSHIIKVVAYDLAGNTESQEITVIFDNNPPVISDIEYDTNPTSETDVDVHVRVTDSGSGVKKVILSYTNNNGGTWYNITMQKTDSDIYYTKIPRQTPGTKVIFKIITIDNAGNIAVSNEYTYTIRQSNLLLYASIGIITLIIAIAGIVFVRKKQIT